MQETTFNSPYQANGEAIYSSIHLWLTALYSEASQKKPLLDFNFNQLAAIDSVKHLESLIKYNFKNTEVLINALTQSTFCYEFKHLKNSSLKSNERLEFLGDSLINFLVAKILYKLYPELNEGALSKLRGSLVNELSLSKLARCTCLGENLLLGKGEHQNLGKLKNSLLADAFEALIAAIYIDSLENLDVLEKSFLGIIEIYEKESGQLFFDQSNLDLFDSKTRLQELSVSLFQTLPLYKFREDKEGFIVELWIGDRKLAEGVGHSKKKLEKELARIVLDEKRYQL